MKEILTKLSETDEKILYWTGQGLGAKEVGEKIQRGARTIEQRLYFLRMAFGCSSTLQLVSQLYESGVMQEINEKQKS